MLSLESVEKSILELESGDTSFSVCERLAWLYIVRDHLRGYNVSPEAAIAQSGASEFLKTVNGRNPDKVWPVMDELMDTVKALHPKVYDRVLEKIRDGE